jgi:hypothetical protein
MTEAAISMVQAERSDDRELAAKIELVACEAHEAARTTDRSVDTVIMNSVVQYFPGREYLYQVLDSLLDIVVDGGVMFVGDVRSSELQRAMYAEKHLAISSNVEWGALREAVDDAMAREPELFLPARFFLDYAKSRNRIARVELLCKRGRIANELTKFRYDVLLWVGIPQGLPHWREIVWPIPERAPRDLADRVLLNGDNVLIRNVPNGRLHRSWSINACLAADECQTTPVEVVELQGSPLAGHADPQDFWDMEVCLPPGWHVKVLLDPEAITDRFDVMVWRGDAGVAPIALRADQDRPPAVTYYRTQAPHDVVSQDGAPHELPRLSIMLPTYAPPGDFHSWFRNAAEVAQHAASRNVHACWLPEDPTGEDGRYESSVVCGGLLASVPGVRLRATVPWGRRHHIELAEEWLMLDQLSQGSIGMVLNCSCRGSATTRLDVRSLVQSVRSSWNGDSFTALDAQGDLVSVPVYPRPHSTTPDLWLRGPTAEVSVELAGELGLNVLIELTGQDQNKLEGVVHRYRASLERNGFDPSKGVVAGSVDDWQIGTAEGAGWSDQSFVKAVRGVPRFCFPLPFLEKLQKDLIQTREAGIDEVVFLLRARDCGYFDLELAQLFYDLDTAVRVGRNMLQVLGSDAEMIGRSRVTAEQLYCSLPSGCRKRS